MCGGKKKKNSVHSYLVARVIAGEVGEDAGCTSQHVDVVRAELGHQDLQQTVEPLLPRETPSTEDVNAERANIRGPNYFPHYLRSVSRSRLSLHQSVHHTVRSNLLSRQSK